MRRKLLNLATALSLLLCVAAAALWVRSVGHVGAVYWIGPQHKLQVTSTDGVLGVEFARDSGLRPPVSGTSRLYGWFSLRKDLPAGRDRASLTTLSFNEWGFGFHVGETRGQPRGWWRFGGRKLFIIYVPYWLPVIGLSMPPALALLSRWRRSRRVRSNLCRSCGYDLRATPDRCPECGTVPELCPEPPHNPPMQRTATASSGAVE